MILAEEVVRVWSYWIGPVLEFVIGLGLVILVHEFGHFLAAKWAGIKVERFAIGMGPKLWAIRRGETEYRIGALPLGGYVQMLGQNDFRPGAPTDSEPRSWERATTAWRFVVLFAGVTMNVLFAALLFVIVYLVGIRFTAPVVGGTIPGTPAATVVLPEKVAAAPGAKQPAGLQPGDRIIAINGEKIRRFEQIRMDAVLSIAGQSFQFTVERDVHGKPLVFAVAMKPARQESASYGAYYGFGIVPVSSTIIASPGTEGYAGSGRFVEGDRIVAVAGEEVRDMWNVQPILQAHAGEVVTYSVLREGKQVEVPLKPMTIIGSSTRTGDVLNILGMAPGLQVFEVQAGSPAAKADVVSGDIITRYAGVDWPTRTQLLELNKSNVGRQLSLVVQRKGKLVPLTITPRREDDHVLLGVVLMPAEAQLRVAHVAQASAAAKAGIVSGAEISSVNGQKVDTWAQLYARLRKAYGDKVTIGYTVDGAKHVTHAGPLTGDVFNPADYDFLTRAIAGMLVLQTPVVRGNPVQAIAWSVSDTEQWMASVCKSLWVLFTGRASFKSLSGPVGIGADAIIVAREGITDLAYFLAVISALLAVFNILPLPVLDGGQVVYLLIEIIRGKPLPTKVLLAIQSVGWMLIIALFVAVTWQDIWRLVHG